MANTIYEVTTADGKVYEIEIPEAAQPVAIEAEEAQLSFPQALGLGLRDTGVAALQGINAATGGLLKSAYERPIAPSPRLEAFGYTPQPTNRVFPTPITPEGKFMGAVDTALGSVIGLPGRAFTGTAQGLAKIAPKIPQIPPFVQRAIAGGVGGAAFDVAQPETYGRNIALGAGGAAVIPPAISGVARAFKRSPRPQTIPELMQVPEARVKELAPKDQRQWFAIRRSQIQQTFASRETALTQERQALNRELSQASQQQAVVVRERLASYLPKRSQHFRDLFEADMGGRQEVSVPDEELRQFLVQRYGKNPEVLASISARLGIANQPPPPPSGQLVFTQAGEILSEQAPAPTRTLLSIYQQAKDFGQTLPQAVRQSLRLYNADEYMTDKSIGALIDFLETKGANLSNSRGFWRESKEVIDQAVSEFRPFLTQGTRTQVGASRLRKLALGIDDGNTVYGKTLADYLGMDSLPGDLSRVVSKLDVNAKSRLAMTLERMEAASPTSPLAQTQYVSGKGHEASVEKWNRVLTLLRVLTTGGAIAGGLQLLKRD